MPHIKVQFITTSYEGQFIKRNNIVIKNLYLFAARIHPDGTESVRTSENYSVALSIVER